jgi:hypothetical protein
MIVAPTKDSALDDTLVLVLPPRRVLALDDTLVLVLLGVPVDRGMKLTQSVTTNAARVRTWTSSACSTLDIHTRTTEDMHGIVGSTCRPAAKGNRRLPWTFIVTHRNRTA